MEKVWASDPRAFISHPTSNGMVNNFPNFPTDTLSVKTFSADTLTVKYLTGPQDGSLRRGYEGVWFGGTSGRCAFQYVLKDTLGNVITSHEQVWYRNVNQTPSYVSAFVNGDLVISESYLDTVSPGTPGTGTDYYRNLGILTKIIQGDYPDTTTTTKHESILKFLIKVGY